jgi:regulator of sigma E protease
MQIVVFVLMLSVLILVHEFGHFFMAKLFKMRVDEFGIGLPPRAKKLFTWRKTLFSINWLPLGGFVKLFGEDMDDPAQANSPDAFFNKPIWQRAGVLTAGVIMNFLLGVFAFGIVYTYLGIPTKTDKVFVVEVGKNTPAEAVGIKVDTEIKKLSFDKTEVPFVGIEDFIKKIEPLKGKEIELSLLQKDGLESVVKIVPRVSPPVGEGALGVSLSNIEMKMYPIWQRPFRGVVVGVSEAWAWGKEITVNLGNVLWGILTGKGVPKDVSGPIGIYKVSEQVYKVGWIAMLQFMAILSINLAILNIMPFPALDGGRIFFLGIEMIIGKKLKNRIEGYVHTVGMIFLLGLMVLITVRDVVKLIWPS